jgi:hypothetical protein
MDLIELKWNNNKNSTNRCSPQACSTGSAGWIQFNFKQIHHQSLLSAGVSDGHRRIDSGWFNYKENKFSTIRCSPQACSMLTCTCKMHSFTDIRVFLNGNVALSCTRAYRSCDYHRWFILDDWIHVRNVWRRWRPSNTETFYRPNMIQAQTCHTLPFTLPHIFGK